MHLWWPVDDDLFHVVHRWVEVDGARIHYVDEGSGEPILLLHGNPTWSFLYRKIIVGLRDRFRCVALDYPGYGMSTAPLQYCFTPREHSTVVEHFVDKLELENLTMMVQDWGGPIGLGFAGRRPELVHRIVIGNTFAWPLTDRRVRVFSAALGGWPGRLLNRWFNLVPRVFFIRGFAHKLPPRVVAQYMAPWRDPLRRAPAAIGPRQLVAASEYLTEVESGLARVADRPALIVWGLRDFAFRDAMRKRFEDSFPNHRTRLFDDASHFLQEDAGERIADEIKSFVSETGGTDARRQHSNG
jgi:haloalkane dehalogenase